MKCPKCQFENRAGAKFCKECGGKLEFVCSECGTVNEPGSKFCDECGHDLRKPPEITEIDYSNPQSYTPKFLADTILTTRGSIEGERKLVTVLFADVANFTSLAEKLDPEEVHQIMDGCFKILMDEIHKYEGTINQFTGDGVMALFGAPVAHEDHAQRACHAALAIQTAMVGYGIEIENEYDIDFKMRIGINSGPVIVGVIGDDLRMDYTAVGDTTNLAARMETMARPGRILLSENMQSLVKTYFELKPFGPVPVKGKAKPQEVYELIKSSKVETRFEASVSKGLTRFVGRKNSMAAINRAWNSAISGSGQVLGIVGEAGVGKSRLLLEFRNSLSGGDYAYLEGRCLHYGGSMSYLPFLDILRTYFGIKEGENEDIIKGNIEARLKALETRLVPETLPAFHDLFSLEVGDEAWQTFAPKERRERTFDVLTDLMIRISRDKPLVLAIEDLHWIDKTTEEFLSYFIDRLAQSRILLILCNRPEYHHRWYKKPYYGKIGLNQLKRESSAELISAILESNEVGHELKQLIFDRADGNPLFMEEFTHSLLENGSIEKQDNQYVLSPKFAAIEVPETIQGIIAARMDRLEDTLKRILQVASVIGRDFAFRILQSITGMQEKLKSYLVILQGFEFVYEKQLLPELEYIFKHALTREVAYNSLLLKKRKELHEMIGRAIEKIYEKRLEEFYEMIAYHFSKSDNHESAHHYLKLSGAKAIKRHSAWEAYRFYKESLNALRRMPETEDNLREQLEVIRLTHDPIYRLGYPEEWLAVVQHGEELAGRLEDEKSLALINVLMAAYYMYQGGELESSRYLEKSLQKSLKIEDMEIMAQTAVGLTYLNWQKGNVVKIAEVSLPVIELLEKTNNQSEFFGQPFNVYAYLCSFTAQAMACNGNFSKGQILSEKGLNYASELGDSFTLGFCEFMYGALFTVKHDFKPAIKHLLKALSNFEKLKNLAGLGLAYCHIINAYTGIGDLKRAEYYLEIFSKIPDSEKQSWIFFSNYFLSAYHIASGNPEAAKSGGEEALRYSRQIKNKFGEGLALIALGRSLGKVDPPDYKTAIDTINMGLKILEAQNLRSFSFLGYIYLGELYSACNNKKAAVENLQRAIAMCQDMGIEYWLPKIRERTNLARIAHNWNDGMLE